VTRWNDGSRVPGTSNGAPGGSDPPNGSGVAADLSSPPCYVGDRKRGEHIARLMRCPEAARLNWTVRDQPGRPVCEIAALSVTEKAPEQSGKADARVAPRKRSTLLVWGPGAGVEAAGRLWFGHNKPGVASLPQSCRQVVLARATLKHNNKAHLKVWGSVRMKEIAWENGPWDAESAT